MTTAPSHDRLPLIDALRGFALFGILLVNLEGFAHPLEQMGLSAPRGQSPLDHAVSLGIAAFAEAKFYALFAFLFGLGFSLRTGGGFFRRLGVLFAMGLSHGFLIWAGDILTAYAVLGVGLLLFGRLRPKAQVIWGGLWMVSSWLLSLLIVLGWAAFLQVPELVVQVRAALEANGGLSSEFARAHELFAHGTWWEIFKSRAGTFTALTFGTLFMLGGQLLGLMLLGSAVGRSGLLRGSLPTKGLLTVLAFGLLVGVPVTALKLWGQETFLALPFDAPQAPWAYLADVMGSMVGGAALAAAYAALFALLWQRTGGVFLSWLAPVGRMSLTNYLLQSVACTLLFNSYGLGLFGQVGAAAGLGICFVLFGAQVAVSHVWMRRFHFGPAEWVWRAATQGRPPPFVKRPAVVPALSVDSSRRP